MVELRYETPLEEAIFLQRYKRFFSDVEMGTEVRTVHCANSGSMKSCLVPGCDALILDSNNPKRKLRYTLEALKLIDGWAILNTGRANQLFQSMMERREEIHAHAVEFDGQDLFLQDFGSGSFRPEAKFSASTRFDGLLETSDKRTWIELKSVSMRKDEKTLAFPDAVTTRGAKHLAELIEAQERGDGAVLVFVITRGTYRPTRELAGSLQIAEDIDPTYGEWFRAAREKGVEMRILVMGLRETSIVARGYYRFGGNL